MMYYFSNLKYIEGNEIDFLSFIVFGMLLIKNDPINPPFLNFSKQFLNLLNFQKKILNKFWVLLWALQSQLLWLI